jgi:hypothetical protein
LTAGANAAFLAVCSIDPPNKTPKPLTQFSLLLRGGFVFGEKSRQVSPWHTSQPNSRFSIFLTAFFKKLSGFLNSTPVNYQTRIKHKEKLQ